MDYTGKTKKGVVYIDTQGISEDDDLQKWIQTCEDFILALPLKIIKLTNKKKPS